MLSNCPNFVIEGDDVNCSCQTSGSPPAVVTWYNNGVIDSVLVLRNVSRSLDGQNYTCKQYWGGVNSNWRTTTYSVQVHCTSLYGCDSKDEYIRSMITLLKVKVQTFLRNHSGEAFYRAWVDFFLSGQASQCVVTWTPINGNEKMEVIYQGAWPSGTGLVILHRQISRNPSTYL